jgi:hypothetical protein
LDHLWTASSRDKEELSVSLCVFRAPLVKKQARLVCNQYSHNRFRFRRFDTKVTK